jgi:hypothetical protein
MLQNKDDFIITGHEYVEYMHVYLSMGCLVAKQWSASATKIHAIAS